MLPNRTDLFVYFDSETIGDNTVLYPRLTVELSAVAADHKAKPPRGAQF